MDTEETKAGTGLFKQSKRKKKVSPSDERVGRLKKEYRTGGPNTSSFYWSLWTWVIRPRTLGHVSSTLPTWWVGEFMALYGQTEAVIFHML
jgi:hypothetical protein